FVGGSLIERGGHNMLEPAAWGLPVITGQSDFNFREISAGLQQAGALVKVADGAGLARELVLLAADEAERRRRGEQAAAMLAANRGALERLMAAIDELR